MFSVSLYVGITIRGFIGSSPPLWPF